MQALVERFKEHRVQLAIGCVIATLAGLIMCAYENDFEHRYDENYRGKDFDRVVPLPTIDKVVSEQFKLPAGALTTKQPAPDSLPSRRLAVYLAEALKSGSQKEIAATFAGGDETLAREYSKAAVTALQQDPELQATLKKLYSECDRLAELRDIFPHGYKRLLGYDWLENIELKTYDTRFEQRGRQPKPSNIVIVAYDDATADQIKIWPWPRDFHAHVVRKLKRAGARVIAFDTRFDAYQGMKPVKDFDNYDDLLKPSPGDLEFAKACKEADNVIVTADVIDDTSDWRELAKYRTSTGIRYISFPYVDDQGDHWERAYGFSRKMTDLDNSVRRGSLVFEVRNPGAGTRPEKYASIAALTAGFYLSAGKKQEFDEEKLCEELAKGRFNGKRIPVVGGLQNPDNIWHGSSCLVDFLGPRSTVETVSYYQVLSDDPAVSDSSSPEDMLKTLEETFKDKIALVGPTMELLHDSHPSPFATGKFKMPGVEIHANTIDTLLRGTYYRSASRAANIAAILMVAYLTVLLGVLMSKPVASLATAIDRRLQFKVRGMKVRIYGPVWFLLYGTLGIGPPVVLYYFFALYLFAVHSTWITVVYPAVAGLLTDIGVVATMFLTEEVNRRKALSRFERMVSPDVLDEILEHPGEAEELPKPRRVEATLIFTDLQGFTTLSEQNSAETVVEVLNEYITLMNAAIFKHGGTIDKYEGDAIMIEFGVPKPQPDHAKRAVLCAIDMQEACTRFRTEVCRKNGWPDVYVRIGVNSGEVIAGLIGGGDRFDYTTIGDTVNLAARLEPLNKQVGSWILIGDRTYEQIKDLDLVIADPVPGIQVKGKTQAVDVFAIRGLKATGRRDHIWGEDADKAPKAPTESAVPAPTQHPAAPEPELAGIADGT